MRAHIVLQLAWTLLLVELASCRTARTHQVTTIDANGEKVTQRWTTTDDTDESPTNANSLQSETMHVGSSSLPSEELIRQAGLMHGMEPDAINELLKTKQPVVRTSTDEEGLTRTTTYTLEPDGSISRKTVIQSKPRYFTVQQQWHDGKLEPLPASSVVPQTATVKKVETPLSSAHNANGNPANDWEWAPVPNKPEIGPATRTWHTDPNSFFNTRTNWPSVIERRGDPVESTTVKLPESWDPNTWYRSSSPNFGSVVPKRPFVPNVGSDPFDGIESNTPGTVTKTYVDDKGRTVTSTYTVGPTKWTTRTFDIPTNTWSKPEPSTTPLPSLEEFLKTQYGTTTKRNKVAATSTTPTSKSTPSHRSASNNNSKPVTTIKLEDIPVTEILEDGKPVNEHFLQTLPRELRPATGNRTPIKTLNIPRTSAEAPGRSPPTVETNVKSLTKTIHTSSLPTNADLDPGMQEILQRAGINPDDIKSINGDTITKTRTEPDGKVVTTTYKVRTIPRIVHPTNIGDHDYNALNRPTVASNEDRVRPSHSFPLQYPTTPFPGHTYSNVAPLRPSNPINDYLSKVDLNSEHILTKNGDVVKTIIDDEGRVLTARFTLSTVKGDKPENRSSSGKIETKPLK